MSPPPSIAILTLPQYEASTMLLTRVLEGWSDNPIEQIIDRAVIDERDPNEPTVWQREATSDLMCYFAENLELIRKEFFDELSAKINPERATLLLDDIASEWSSGEWYRTANRRLEASCREYFSKVSPNAAHQLRDSTPTTKASYSGAEIAALATCTQQALTKHLHMWIDRHPDGRQLGSHSLYLRRGLALPEPYKTGKSFRDPRTVAAYSLSITVCEQFSTQSDGPVAAPSLFHIPCDLALSRALFFSPLIEGMPNTQLEIALMPPDDDLLVIYQGKFGNTHEHLLCARGEFERERDQHHERLANLAAAFSVD